MKLSRFCFYLIPACFISLCRISAQTSPEPCGEPNFTIEGKFINSSAAAPILEVSNLAGFNIKTGNKGELSKYFEETMFGGNISGWLGIGTVEVTHIDVEKNQVTFKVLEKKSEVTVNGKTQSHFVAGKIIKFSQVDYKAPQQQKLYYDNSELKSVGNIICGKETGDWVYYHKGGKVKSQGSYNDQGELSGYWTYYSADGIIEKEGGYSNGKRTGLWKYFYPDGTIKEQKSFIDDKITGPFTKYNSTGKVVEEGNLVNDVEEGHFKMYAGGTLLGEGDYKAGKKTGTWKTYFDNGNVELEVTRVNGKMTGPYKIFYLTGELMLEGNYDENEKTTGEQKTYYLSGQLKSSYMLVRGAYVGPFKQWYANGQLEVSGTYSSGDRLEGDYTSFYENGSPKSAGKYEFGEKKGKWTDWDEKGKKKTTNYK